MILDRAYTPLQGMLTWHSSILGFLYSLVQLVVTELLLSLLSCTSEPLNTQCRVKRGFPHEYVYCYLSIVSVLFKRAPNAEHVILITVAQAHVPIHTCRAAVAAVCA